MYRLTTHGLFFYVNIMVIFDLGVLLLENIIKTANKNYNWTHPSPNIGYLPKIA